MWFVLLGIALVTVAISGAYFRRRVIDTFREFGFGRRACRFASWTVLWLLFGVPIIVFFSVLVSVALGRESLVNAPTGLLEWVLIYPFWIAVLVMLQSVPFLLVIDGVRFVARKRYERAVLSRVAALLTVATIGVFSVYTPLRIVIERDRLDVNQYTVGKDGPALRIAFVADLQVDHHTNGDRVSEVVERVNESKADLILFGGDWINTGPRYIDAAADAGAKLESRLGVSSVRGDHEHFAYRDQERSAREVSNALAKRGVEMIDNEVRTIEHDGKTIAIIYLSYNYIVRAPNTVIDALVEKAASADYTILVSHQFDDALAERVVGKVDLALLAHTHGGQVNPFVGIGHISLARAETPYVAGRYELDGTTLIVTSGIGFSIAPFRYAAPASIEIIDLHLGR